MKKIMFNDKYGLTDAVLKGTKTQTRRIVPKEVFSLHWDVRETFENPKAIYVEDEYGDFNDIRNTRFAHYKKGEIVAVAQSYDQVIRSSDEKKQEEVFDYMHRCGFAGLDNKMFVKAELMPHQIRITDVRVEQLQDISDEDCIKEGIEEIGMIDDPGYIYHNDPVCQTDGYDTPQEAYASLIDRISGKGTWDSNPYVFVYDFELVR